MHQESDTLKKRGSIREIEFIALMAFLMSNVALSIDAILPALNDIGLDLKVADNSDLQLIIICIFLGLGIGELLFGTLSDSFGRKPIVYIGVVIFIIASFLIIEAPTLTVLLIGRIFQGIGLSAVRSVCVAIIRDTYEGDQMARIMSFIVTIFILVPMLAPLLGTTILKSYNWQAIFYFQLLFISCTILWFHFRQNETLKVENRIAFSRHLFGNGLKEFFRYRNSVLCTITAGLLHGTFIAYLGAAQHIFQGQFLMIDEFPYIFGGLAFSFGVSTLLNGFLVEKLGMMRLVKSSLYVSVVFACTFLVLFPMSANPEFEYLIAFLLIQFLSFGFVFGNLSSMVLQPIGHIAGVGSAIYSFIATAIGVLTAVVIGHFIRDTVAPLFVGFLMAGIAGIILIRFVKSIEQPIK